MKRSSDADTPRGSESSVSCAGEVIDDVIRHNVEHVPPPISLAQVDYVMRLEARVRDLEAELRGRDIHLLSQDCWCGSETHDYSKP